MSRASVGLFGVFAIVALAGCQSADLERRALDAEQRELELQVELDMHRQELAESFAERESLEVASARQAEELAGVQEQLEDAVESARLHAERNEELLAVLESQPGPEPRLSGDPGATQRALLAQASAFRGHPKISRVEIDPVGNLELTLDPIVNFASGKVVVATSGKRSLESIRNELIHDFGTYKVRVEGHCDSQPLKRTKGRFGTQERLGLERALSVVRHLENEFGIEPTRLISASRGDSEPIARNDTKSGRDKNRRVQLVVIIPRDVALSLAMAK